MAGRLAQPQVYMGCAGPVSVGTSVLLGGGEVDGVYGDGGAAQEVDGDCECAAAVVAGAHGALEAAQAAAHYAHALAGRVDVSDKLHRHVGVPEHESQPLYLSVGYDGDAAPVGIPSRRTVGEKAAYAGHRHYFAPLGFGASYEYRAGDDHPVDSGAASVAPHPVLALCGHIGIEAAGADALGACPLGIVAHECHIPVPRRRAAAR